MVVGKSMFHLHINTLDSPIKVKYAILDSDNKVVHNGGHESKKVILDSQLITPVEMGSVK